MLFILTVIINALSRLLIWRTARGVVAKVKPAAAIPAAPEAAA